MPTRTCVGCRTQREQAEMQRFVRHGDRWTADGGRRADGRGVYLCRPQCAQAVVKNKRYPGLGAAASAHFEHQDKRMSD